MRTPTIVAALVVAAAASTAYAQEVAPAPTQGPLILEPIRNPFVVAPEYKLTEIDGEWGQLAGAYAGRLLDEQLLIGGAIYSLANRSDDFEMTYGGLLVGWSMPDARIRFGGRALVGGGTATLPVVFARDVHFGTRTDPRFIDSRSGDPRISATSGTQTVRVLGSDDFAFVEPEVNAVTRITDHVGVDLSLGYRWTAFEDVLRDRLDGVTGSVAVRFGW